MDLVFFGLKDLLVNLLIFHAFISCFPFYLNIKIQSFKCLLELIYLGELYFADLMHKRKRYKSLPAFTLGATFNDCLHVSLFLSNTLRMFKESSVLDELPCLREPRYKEESYL